ncbi:DUF4326 domain-containing protein [Deinococcus soli (ex Cha et al. 2016)]|uniref:Uncharacterized protein n=2 Tax=Deinococcus soli (ex Cha et al. 2016) TaxID=1309411 RepID=A0ACC6KQ48_9DEIO|nr:DUF4326 domain-containing protein [Deinococcus soli (ex Cha et al. 2016)]MDR6221425.1 hypothetical protein [Deinococcus soli (ex Cha et al. 2016)]MDR6331406.1 hypothetical protein [Deinococcus soli (ex Cha et al. 2016)]MDR6754574.1 hypothetical protein [Deinococcus soli (ex Cha et al. 2016)]
MIITVGRLGDSHDTGHIEYVGRGRGSVLGNPLPVIGRSRWTSEAAAWTSHLIHAAHLTGTEREQAQRALHHLGFEQGEAAALYLHVLREQCRTDTPERRAVQRLAVLATQGPVHLQCWCTPKPCHAEHIRSAILGYAQTLVERRATAARATVLG